MTTRTALTAALAGIPHTFTARPCDDECEYGSIGYASRDARIAIVNALTAAGIKHVGVWARGEITVTIARDNA